MDLKTTTRPRRNDGKFREARALLDAAGLNRPVDVLEVGPGLAVRFFGPLGEEGRPAAEFFQRIESGIRRIPMPDSFYESYETGELLGAMDGLAVKLTVIDINPRVLEIVRRLHPRVLFRSMVVDLGQLRPAGLVPIYGTFDLVVANAVLGRIPSGARVVASENLARLVRPGGLVLTGTAFTAADCDPVEGSAGFYRRRSG